MKRAHRMVVLACVTAVLVLPSLVLAGKGGKPDKPPKGGGDPKEVLVQAEFSDNNCSDLVTDRICGDGKGPYVNAKRRGYFNQLLLYEGRFQMTIRRPDLLGRWVDFRFEPLPPGTVECRNYAGTETFTHQLPNYADFYGTGTETPVWWVRFLTFERLECNRDPVSGECNWTEEGLLNFLEIPEGQTVYAQLVVSFLVENFSDTFWLGLNSAPDDRDMGIAEVKRTSPNEWTLEPLTADFPYLGPNQARHIYTPNGLCEIGIFEMPFELTITRLD
jgi:hypothetical protein